MTSRATHMLGHELTTALRTRPCPDPGCDPPPPCCRYGARRSAANCCSMLTASGACVTAAKIWRIDQAIEKTRQFFEAMQVPTRLPAYGIGAERHPGMLAQLERHGMVALGEHGSFNLEGSPGLRTGGLAGVRHDRIGRRSSADSASVIPAQSG